MKFSEMVNNQRTRNAVVKYKLEEDRYKEGSWYPEWRPSDEIFYTMYQDGFRYDHSGGEPLYPGSWEKGFRTLEEACIYTVKYFQNHRDSGVRANDLHVVQVNGTIYGSEDVGDPEGYEGEWYSYAKVRNIAKRASNIPDADESYDASARKSQSSVKKNSETISEAYTQMEIACTSAHEVLSEARRKMDQTLRGGGLVELNGLNPEYQMKYRNLMSVLNEFEDYTLQIRSDYTLGLRSYSASAKKSYDGMKKSPYNSDDYQRIINRLQTVKRELDSIGDALFVNITEPEYIRKMELLQDTLEDIIALVETKKKH